MKYNLPKQPRVRRLEPQTFLEFSGDCISNEYFAEQLGGY